MGIIHEIPDDNEPKSSMSEQIKPDHLNQQQQPETLIQRIPRTGDNLDIDIPYDESRRIVEESGVLRLVNRQGPSRVRARRKLPKSSFVTSLMISLGLELIFAIFQWSFHYHYNEPFEISTNNGPFRNTLEKMSFGFPALFSMVFITQKYKKQKWMQLLLLCSSMILGFWNLRLITKRIATYRAMSISPALSTFWAYTLMQMELLYASIALFSTFFIFAIINPFLNVISR